MIALDTYPGTSGAVFRLAPNSSLSWKQSKLLFLFFAGVLSVVSLYFSLMGAWLVLPFAGLELAVLGVGLYLQCRWSAQEQIIELAGDSIRISSGRRNRSTVLFPLHWFQIKLQRNRHHWYPSRLIVGSHGRFLEIGRYLVEEERERVAEQLQSAVDASRSRHRYRAHEALPSMKKIRSTLSADNQDRRNAKKNDRRRRVGNASQL